MLAYRLNSDGTTDTTFGIGGADILRSVSIYGVEAGAIAIEGDGKILLANLFEADFFRLTTTGLPDPTSGEGGVCVLYNGTNEDSYGDVLPENKPEPGSAGIATFGGKILVAESDTHGTLGRLLEYGSTGDYNGDGIADPAIYISSLGVFAYKASGGGAGLTIAFGAAGAGQTLPAPGAFAGSGEDELGLYFPAAGAFAVLSLTTGSSKMTMIGTPGPGNALPAPGDYDLSGKTEYAVYRPATGSFLHRPTAGGPDVTVPFGTAGAGRSIPVPADYDGVGHADLAVYIPSQGQPIYRPADGGPDVAVPFGSTGAGKTLPSPADYSGSGKEEVGAYLPAFGTFAYRPAAGGGDVAFPVGVANQTIPFDLASDIAAAGSGSGFAIHADSASMNIPLTTDLLDSLAGPTSKKKAGHA